MMDFRQDMVFSTSLYWNYLNEFDFPPQLRNPHRSGGGPGRKFYESGVQPQLLPLVQRRSSHPAAPSRNLRTLHIVVDRFFSTGDSSSAEHRTLARDNLDPFRSNSRLRDVVALLSRDKHGFVEYDTFARSTKYDWAIPAMVLPRVILDGRYRSLSGLELTKVLNLARAYSSHPLAMKPKETMVSLVVDFDANVGRHEFLSYSAERRNMTLKPTKI
ncbi:hypothetical protein PG987_005139 [Apiospora arundinis]